MLEFITKNQTLIMTALLCATWLINKLINYMAAKPQKDIWDKLQPYSNAACQVVFEGVEFLSKSRKMTSAQKALEYADVLSKFSDNWSMNKTEAVANLYAWYAANKEKTQAITADSVAVEK